MTEQAIRVPLTDGKALYGKYREVVGAPLVIFVHGITGDADQHLHFNGARFLTGHGYSTFRFDLYGAQTDARKLIDCTASIHGADLDDVIRYFRALDPARKVAVIGHSFGLPTALLTTEPFDLLISWDGTHLSKLTALGNSKYSTELNAYVWNRPIIKLIGKPLIDEVNELDSDQMMKAWEKPCLFISSDEEFRPESSQRLFDNALCEKRLVVIPNSDHDFTSEDALDALFHETLSWLDEMTST